MASSGTKSLFYLLIALRFSPLESLLLIKQSLAPRPVELARVSLEVARHLRDTGFQSVASGRLRILVERLVSVDARIVALRRVHLVQLCHCALLHEQGRRSLVMVDQCG